MHSEAKRVVCLDMNRNFDSCALPICNGSARQDLGFAAYLKHIQAEMILGDLQGAGPELENALGADGEFVGGEEQGILIRQHKSGFLPENRPFGRMDLAGWTPELAIQESEST